MGIFGSIGGAVKGVLGGVTGQTAARTAQRAGETQARGIENAMAAQRRAIPSAIADMARYTGRAVEQYEPYTSTGRDALAGAKSLYGMQGIPQYTPAEYQAPTAEEVSASPAVQFRMEQAQRAAEMGAAARGGLFGGGHQRQLAQYMQGLASQEYETEAQRRLREAQFAEQQAQFAPQFQEQQRMSRAAGLQDLSGMGLQGAAGIAGLQSGLGTNMANIRTGSGAAEAAAIQAAGQARASGALAGSQARQQAMQNIFNLAGKAGSMAMGGM